MGRRVSPLEMDRREASPSIFRRPFKFRTPLSFLIRVLHPPRLFLCLHLIPRETFQNPRNSCPSSPPIPGGAPTIISFSLTGQTPMAAAAPSDASDGPVLSLINKRLRALRKKHNRILQMEEAISQGKPINKEQEEVLRSKPSVVALIDELEKLRQPLSSAVSEEINLALQRQQASVSSPTIAAHDSPSDVRDDKTSDDKDQSEHDVVQDLLNLLYFGSLFDVKSQSDFTSTMLTRTHERGCCLTYDYVTDDATDLLAERDLDLISTMSGLLISRPVDSNLPHKNALERCIEHAKLWLTKADQPIEPNTDVTCMYCFFFA